MLFVCKYNMLALLFFKFVLFSNFSISVKINKENSGITSKSNKIADNSRDIYDSSKNSLIDNITKVFDINYINNPSDILVNINDKFKVKLNGSPAVNYIWILKNNIQNLKSKGLVSLDINQYGIMKDNYSIDSGLIKGEDVDFYFAFNPTISKKYVLEFSYINNLSKTELVNTKVDIYVRKTKLRKRVNDNNKNYKDKENNNNNNNTSIKKTNKTNTKNSFNVFDNKRFLGIKNLLRNRPFLKNNINNNINKLTNNNKIKFVYNKKTVN